MTDERDSDHLSANEVAERFGCDQALAQQTLQRVQAGELSPREATGRLLAGSGQALGTQAAATQLPGEAAQQPLAATETLDSLIARLGTPPDDIIDLWCRQLSGAAADQLATTGRPLPVIDASDCAINPSGDLLWLGRACTENPKILSNEIDAVSANRIEAFRGLLTSMNPGSMSPAPAGDSPRQNPTGPRLPDPIASEPLLQTAAESKPAGKHSLGGRVVIPALVLVSVAAIVWVLVSNRGDRQNRVARSQPNAPLSRSAADIANAKPAPAIPPSANSPLSLEHLETLDETTASEAVDVVAMSDPVSADAKELLLLETLMPAAAGFDQQAGSVAAATSPPAPADRTDTAAAAKLIDQAGDHSLGPQESPQQTRTAGIKSVKLPAIEEVGAVAELSEDSPRGSFRLEFPIQTPLGLRDIDAGREIIDVASEVAIAVIKTSASGMNLQWTPAASTASSSHSLRHGRLKTDTGDLIYLRPTVEAEHWAIDLAASDLRPTWDLRGPIPPRAARVSISLLLPEDIEAGWIEPINSASPRRCRGLATLSATGGELVSLGIRFDIRGGRKLSCRVRYAARLDPAAPWQVVSRPQLEQLANNLASQSEFVSQQSAQISAIYANADSGLRRELAPQREAIEQRGDSLRELSDRLSKLQSLISKVEAGSKLQLRVWVEWPDRTQTLLETKEK